MIRARTHKQHYNILASKSSREHETDSKYFQKSECNNSNIWWYLERHVGGGQESMMQFVVALLATLGTYMQWCLQVVCVLNAYSVS